ncbi:MAG: GNAT family N-acetyltransferase [Terracidiphilus sp.]
MIERLETERLILRQWRDSDRRSFRELNSDPRVMEFMPTLLTPEASDEMMDRIQKGFLLHDFGLFAAELRMDQSFLGFIGLSVPGYDAPFMPAVEIGWRIAARHWGCGLATEGAREVLRFAFESAGLDSVVSFTVPGNIRSRRVMEKLGMTHDSADDFDHPRLPVGHALQHHVLYRLHRRDWKSFQTQKSRSKERLFPPA